MRASILSSFCRFVIGHSAKVLEWYDIWRSQPCVDPGHHVVEHLVALRLVEDFVIQPRVDLQLDVGLIPRSRPAGGCHRAGSAGRRNRGPPEAERSMPVPAAAWSRRPAAARGRFRRGPCRGTPAGRSCTPSTTAGSREIALTSSSCTGRPGSSDAEPFGRERHQRVHQFLRRHRRCRTTPSGRSCPGAPRRRRTRFRRPCCVPARRI